MKDVISKELLSVVKNSNVYLQQAGYDGYFSQKPDINVIANDCKEWAKSLKCFIFSGYNDFYGCYIAVVNVRYDDWNLFDYMTKSDSDSDAVIQACQWILDNKAQQ